MFTLVLLHIHKSSISIVGISSKSTNHVSFQGSPVSAGATEFGLISVQFPNPSTISNGPGSESPKYVAHFSCQSIMVVWFMIIHIFLEILHFGCIVVNNTTLFNFQYCRASCWFRFAGEAGKICWIKCSVTHNENVIA